MKEKKAKTLKVDVSWTKTIQCEKECNCLRFGVFNEQIATYNIFSKEKCYDAKRSLTLHSICESKSLREKREKSAG